MILFTHNTSPFGRLVILAAHVLDIISDIELRDVNSRDENDEIRKINPLGKMPALVSGKNIYYDSRVILEYMDFIAIGKKIFPSDYEEKLIVQTELSRAIGMMDAAVLIVYERRLRPEDKVVESIIEYQRDKIVRCLEEINNINARYEHKECPNAAELGLVCCLDYLDMREQVDWREYAPKLNQWVSTFSALVPGYHETLPY